jgi:alkanesulfonate monooxygenase SsuD/methylene tetrahydromethanopterin reductase-like flavin-dependent oxidoreductase (luciferase family)
MSLRALIEGPTAVQVAEDVATLDIMSEGRVVFGVELLHPARELARDGAREGAAGDRAPRRGSAPALLPDVRPLALLLIS